MRVRTLLAASATGLLLLVVPAQAANAASAVHPRPIGAKACDIKTSVLHSKTGSKETISISKVGADAKVMVSFKAKDKTTTASTTSSKTGTASVLYSFGKLAKKSKVDVSVTATEGGATWACKKSFISA